MKTNRLFAVFTACALTLSLLAGCGAKPAETPPPDAAQPADPSDNNALQGSTMDALTALVGQPDAQAVDTLGEGELAKAADGSSIGREYAEFDVLDKKAAVSLLYDASGETVESINALFLDASFDDVQSALAQSYGEPTEQRSNEESGGKSAIFKAGSATVELLDAYGTVSLQITT